MQIEIHPQKYPKYDTIRKTERSWSEFHLTLTQNMTPLETIQKIDQSFKDSFPLGKGHFLCFPMRKLYFTTYHIEECDPQLISFIS